MEGTHITADRGRARRRIVGELVTVQDLLSVAEHLIDGAVASAHSSEFGGLEVQIKDTERNIKRGLEHVKAALTIAEEEVDA
jgi:hypothetical protein